MTHHIQALETRRHFVVSAYVLMPGPLSNAAVPTAFVTGDASADTINVTGSLAPAGSAYKYNFAVEGVPDSPFNANDLWVYGYGGNDIIKLTYVDTGTVSGGAGADTIRLLKSTGVSVVPLSPAEREDFAVDLADRLILDSSQFCSVQGGEGADLFNTSGTSLDNELFGGNDPDTFTLNGRLNGAFISGGLGDDVMSIPMGGTVNLDGASIFGDEGGTP